jgi:hypothetical protein
MRALHRIRIARAGSGRIRAARRILAVSVLLSWVMLATACTTAAGDATSAKGDPSAEAAAVANAQLNFARCMRDHGQNVPDPDPATRELRFPTPSSHERGSPWDIAVQACQHFLPGGAFAGPPDAQELEQLRAFAVCMRAHDIDMSDPETTGPDIGSIVIRGRLANASRTELDNDPVYKVAMAACKDKLPASADGGTK